LHTPKFEDFDKSYVKGESVETATDERKAEKQRQPSPTTQPAIFDSVFSPEKPSSSSETPKSSRGKYVSLKFISSGA
jgi:hypothetical protein